MIENYRTGLLWDIMRRCEPVLTGLRRAGFTGGSHPVPLGRASSGAAG